MFSTFQGELRVETQQVLVRPDVGDNEKPRFDIDRGNWFSLIVTTAFLIRFLDIKSTVSPFLFLSVDLPPPPLFQDAVEKNIIPQVTIHSVLAKYDGITTQVSYDLFASSFPAMMFTSSPGVCWAAAPLQMSATSSLHHSPFQKIHQKYICWGEESYYRHLSPSGTRFQRL